MSRTRVGTPAHARPGSRARFLCGWLVLCGWLAVGCFGCSTLQVQDYYAPVADPSALDPRVEGRCQGDPGRALRGPPSRLRLQSGPLEIGIEASPVSWHSLAAGFLFLPIFPALPPRFFPNREAGPIELSIRILAPRHDDALHLEGASVQLEHASGERVLYTAAQSEERELPARGLSAWDAADGLELSHRPGRADASRLWLRVRGIEQDGVPVELPPVELRRVRGWVYCESSPFS